MANTDTPQLGNQLYKDYCVKYFSAEHSDNWDVVHYLEHCAKLTRIDFCRATGNWIAYLTKVSTSPDSNVASRARKLLDLYKLKGRRSDRGRAKSYYRRHEQQLQKKHRSAAVNLQAVGDNYGTLILHGHGPGQTSKVTSLSSPTASRAPEPGPNKARPTPTPLDDLFSHHSLSAQSSAAPSEYGAITNPSPSPYPSEDPLGRPESEQLPSLVRDYGKHIKALDLSQFSIIDSSDEQLMSVLRAHGYGSISQSYQMPSFPKPLKTHLELYGKVATILQCKTVSLTSEKDWSSPPTSPDLLFCKRWIDRAAETVLSFINDSHGLLLQNLGEGAWEGIYWNLLDLAFINHSSLMLQRRDLSLHALETDPHRITRSLRYDGVVRTREPSTLHTSRLEFLVVEVSRKIEKPGSSKWNSDMGKLHSACRSMLGILKTAVGNDPATVKKLAVVGILQAGRVTLVLVMSCIGENLYYLRRGKSWLLPVNLQGFGKISSLLIAIWKAREITYSTYQTVVDYMSLHERAAAQSDSDPEFL